MTTTNPTNDDVFFDLLDLDGGPSDPRFRTGDEPAPTPAVVVDSEPARPIEIGDAIPESPAPLAVVPESSAPSAPAATVDPIGVDVAPAARGSTRSGGRLASDLPPALRAGIQAQRARNRGDDATATAAQARANELTEAQRKRIEAAQAQARARAALSEVITLGLSGGDGEYRHGLIARWQMKGEKPWQAIADAAARAGVEPPAKRTLKAIASKAVRKLVDGNHKVTTVTAGSEWVVYEPAAEVSIGGSVGAAQVTARLVDDALDLTGPSHLCDVVRAAFARAQSEENVATGEITAWLGDLLRSWGSVSTLYGQWVAPGRYSSTWIALANALADVGLRVPRKPAAVSSREDIAEEVTAGLREEVETTLGRIQYKRDRAKAAAEGKEVDGEKATADLGIKGAINALAEIADLDAKLSMYECLTGPMPEVHAQLTAMRLELTPLLDDGIIRGAMLELYDAPGTKTKAA